VQWIYNTDASEGLNIWGGHSKKKLKEIFKIKRENSKVKIKSEKWKFCQNLMGTSPHVPQMFLLPSFIKTKTKLKTTKKFSIAKIAVEKKTLSSIK
jgi:hypothetical protein